MQDVLRVNVLYGNQQLHKELENVLGQGGREGGREEGREGGGEIHSEVSDR